LFSGSRKKRSKEEAVEQLFESQYKRYWRKLYYTCYSRLQDEELARDMVQDLFRSLWERRLDLDMGEEFEGYLMRAVKFRLSSYYRQKVLHEKKLEEFCYGQEYTDCETEKTVAFNGLVERVNSLVSQLPERCCLIYRLSREQGLNNREIARELQLAEKTVENQLTKALSYLKRHLSPD
jgi:RNA polymerase sigma-70 factor (family 1)